MMPEDRPPGTVHIDLDGAKHIFAAHGWEYPLDRDDLFLSGLEAALDFLGRARVCATFFVIAEDLGDPAKREALGEVVACGHELGSHGWSHRRLSGLGAAELDREIADSRKAIEDGLGVSVRGFRAPGFDLDRAVLERIAEAGYAYDSSLHPSRGGARRLGVDRIPAHPHRPLAGPLLELPLPGHGGLPLPFHPSYALVLGKWYFGTGLRRFARQRAPLVLLFHLTDFARPLSEGIRGPAQRLFTISHRSQPDKLDSCSGMLNLARERFRLVATSEILAHLSGGEEAYP